MDLELMFPSIIFLRKANWEKWTKLFKNLLVFILVYSVFIRTVFTHIPIRISSILREHYFAYISLFHHHARSISLTLLQLHHYTSLMNLSSLQLHHHTSLIKPTSIKSLHLNYHTCSKLITSHNSITIMALHHSRIPSISLATIHLLIQSDFQLSYLTHTFASSFHKFVSTSISKNIWDTSKLLLLCGDVEANPGSRPIATNPVFRTICALKINRGIQQETAPTCSALKCNALYRQASSGITNNQTHHAKSHGSTITLKCPQHGTGIVETTIPPLPVYELNQTVHL